jgi:hypothetical protein
MAAVVIKCWKASHCRTPRVEVQWDVGVGTSCAAAVLTSPMPLLTTCAMLNLHFPKGVLLSPGIPWLPLFKPCSAKAKHVHWLIGMEASFCHTARLLSNSGVKTV